MISTAPKPRVIEYNERLRPLKQERLKERKAVTIGIGFHCNDGIVICSDTEVIWEPSHKYYEHKIYPHGGADWTAVFTYSGNPTMMKMFNGKFDESVPDIEKPLDAAKIKNLIEGILFGIPMLDNDPSALSMLCGIVIPGRETRLIHTEGKIVRPVEGMHFVGTGDSSVIQYLVPTLTKHTNGFTAWQAIHLGVYLAIQAQRYIYGCGGDIEVITIKPNGRIQPTEPHHIKQDLLKLEFLMDRAAAGLFDLTMPDEEFHDHLNRFVKAVKDERQELKAKPVFD